MVAYMFSDPEVEAKTHLEDKLWPSQWTGTTVSTGHPSGPITVWHVQINWDGTPSSDPNREKTVLRVTAWAPKGRMGEAKELASACHAWLTEFASDAIWRATRGTGRVPGVDDDTGLPFCTFTVGLETRPTAVA